MYGRVFVHTLAHVGVLGSKTVVCQQPRYLSLPWPLSSVLDTTAFRGNAPPCSDDVGLLGVAHHRHTDGQ